MQAANLIELAWATLRRTPMLVTLLLHSARCKPLLNEAGDGAGARNLAWSMYVLPLLVSALLEAHPPAAAEVCELLPGGVQLSNTLSLLCLLPPPAPPSPLSLQNHH